MLRLFTTFGAAWVETGSGSRNNWLTVCLEFHNTSRGGTAMRNGLLPAAALLAASPVCNVFAEEDAAVDLQHTWDLTDLYPTVDDWNHERDGKPAGRTRYSAIVALTTADAQRVPAYGACPVLTLATLPGAICPLNPWVR